MSAEIWGWVALAQLLAALTSFAAFALGRQEAERLYCPGPRPSRITRLNPTRWYLRVGCWYNLTGLPLREHGAVRCPECGAVSRPTERLRAGRRWRPQVVGATCLSLSALCVAIPWLKDGSWTPIVPTLALIGFEKLGVHHQPRALRRELYDRVTNGQVSGFTARLLANTLAIDLRDDRRHWNANRASNLLEALWPDSRPALERALLSPDRQSRLIAARILRQRCPCDPSDALLAASVEDLRNDLAEIDLWTCDNAQDAAEYLCQFPEQIEPWLRRAMSSDDAQQRMLAAAVAGYAQMLRLLDVAAPILIEQLRDDDIPGNAKIAAPALYRFGPAVVPYLQPYCESDDRQLRGIARAIIARLHQPERSIRRGAGAIPRITEVTDDPLVNLSISDGIRDLP